MISLCAYLEKKQDGEWVGSELDDLDPELYEKFIGTHGLFSLLGSKHGKGYDNYPTFPFIQPLPLATEESSAGSFKEKYTEDKYRDIYSNLQKYDTCEEFAIDFDENDRTHGMFTIEDALNFDYGSLAIGDASYRDLTNLSFFDLLIYAHQNNYVRILFYFC